MATKDIIVVGASAGGVNALTRLCGALPADLPASVFIAQHVSPTARSVLPMLLNRAGPLPALSPLDRQKIEQGHIYVAPPDHHMLVREGHILVRRALATAIPEIEDEAVKTEALVRAKECQPGDDIEVTPPSKRRGVFRPAPPESARSGLRADSVDNGVVLHPAVHTGRSLSDSLSA